MARGNIHSRLEDLEARLPPPEPPHQAEARRKLQAVLTELGRLKASGAVGYVAGKRVGGESIPRQILGPGYTFGELCELAAERAADKGEIDHDEIPRAVETIRRIIRREDDWEEPVEGEAGRGPGGVGC